MLHILFTLLSIGSPSVLAQAPLVFLLNVENPVSQLTASEISDFYLKKSRTWPHGASVRFIDHKEGSPERVTFLSQVLNKSNRDVEMHWIGQKLYTGASAPLQVPSDMAAASLVASFKGALTYVSPDFKPGKGVKTVPVVP